MFIKFKPKHDDELKRLEQKIMRQIGEETTTVTREFEKSNLELAERVKSLLTAEMDTKLHEFSKPLENAIKRSSEGVTKLWEETQNIQTQIDKLVSMAKQEEDSEAEPEKPEVSDKMLTEQNSAATSQVISPQAPSKVNQEAIVELTQMIESKFQTLDKRLVKLKDETLPKKLGALGETVDDKIKVMAV